MNMTTYQWHKTGYSTSMTCVTENKVCLWKDGCDIVKILILLRISKLWTCLF